MTFEQFKAVAEAHRPDAVVSKHGEFAQCDVGIYFIGANGRQSRVYNYRGSYADILRKLGIKVATQEDLLNVEQWLSHYKECHGKESLFGKGIRDCSKQIAEYEARLAEIMSDRYVRIWEF